MVKINWSDLNIIKEWSKENRSEYEVFDTKTIKKTDKSKKTRYVLINYSNKPVKDNWWVLF